jgi:membrane protease YdiL (CAAX protease family)
MLVALALAVWCACVLRRQDITAVARVTGVWALLQFVFVGFAEEFMYRGHLQKRLIGWLGKKRGWVLASVLMAMAHIGHRVMMEQMSLERALVSSASPTPVSLFLGYLMIPTGNVAVPALVHTVSNWLDL